MNAQAETKQETLLRAVLTELERANATLDIIAESLVNGHGNGPSAGPNFQRALPEYPTFDWETIGAEIVKWDRHGATVVKWQGLEFFRRRHTDYDASIWFSRYTGQKDENDRKVYAGLSPSATVPRIVKGLPEEVTDRLPESSPPPQEQPADSRQFDNTPNSSLETNCQRRLPPPQLPTPASNSTNSSPNSSGRANSPPRAPTNWPTSPSEKATPSPSRPSRNSPTSPQRARPAPPRARQTANGYEA